MQCPPSSDVGVLGQGVMARSIVAAMKANYDMTDDDLIFWTMHIIADEEHGDEGIELVSDYALSAAARKNVFDCTVETSRLFHDMWNLYKQV